ncbi:hypothetical protein PTI98_003028 [Pleurotus ostreatus]|nr:hypothetical protein PTI98_003028 [Pleurotus ostreatus]
MDHIAAFDYLSMYTVRFSACCPISNIAGCNDNFLSRNVRVAPMVNKKTSLNILGVCTRASPLGSFLLHCISHRRCRLFSAQPLMQFHFSHSVGHMDLRGKCLSTSSDGRYSQKQHRFLIRWATHGPTELCPFDGSLPFLVTSIFFLA